MDKFSTVKPNWWTGLTIIMAAYYLWLGVAIGGGMGVVAIAGVILIGSSLAVRTRSTVLAAALDGRSLRPGSITALGRDPYTRKGEITDGPS